jgi:hypothetical protein
MMGDLSRAGGRGYRALCHRGRPGRPASDAPGLEPAGGVVIWVNAGRLTVYGIAGAMGIDRDTRVGWFN